ncbi:hypothetical protein DPMN_034233 [Dreissena polymorpha]|uniref:Uncharacterized protein n=1 Tax=Dreissena polymorpha TaxID=45954 RepID=A0A9D4M756_DREPO|nr:hypothetical protein DPMN_034233 [Dreissena polymorpha]
MLGGEKSRVWEEKRPGEKRPGEEKTGNHGNFLTESATVLNTSTTIRWPTGQFFRKIPDHKWTKKIHSYLRQRWRMQCVVLRKENLMEWITSFLS